MRDERPGSPRDRANPSTCIVDASRKRQPTPAEWTAIRKLFDELIDVPKSKREHRIKASGVGPFIARETQALLEAQEAAVLFDQLLQPAATPPLLGYSSLEPGTKLGPFRIVRLLGRGGMGEVYLAARTTGGFDQRVALKMLRAEAADHAGKFDAERAMLAGLEHPGIARLIDGGIAHDGRPFMALEYVEGEPIDVWCGTTGASLHERLRMFLEICDAVSYAHARLVVHRDIKPANILVDMEGRARLLDFGIAGIMESERREQSITVTLLTPDYAAPEQLEGSAITVATDVYSLGVLLYTLLTGQGPWYSEHSALPALVKRILRGDAPEPSRVAATKVDSPVRSKQIAGDLDSIVLKAMRHVPADRYTSVADFSADIRRHLAFEPVQARAASSLYRIRRFLRRNQLAIGAVAAVTLALIVGIVGILIKARETAQERDIAQAQAIRQRAAAQTMLVMLRDAYDEKKSRSTSVGDMMDTTTRNLVHSLPAESSEVAVRIETLAEIYIGSGNWQGATPLLRGALSRGIEQSDRIGAARLKVKLAIAHLREGNLAAAGPLLDQADRVWKSDPDRFLKEAAETVDARAYWLRTAGRNDQAVALLNGNLLDAERAYKYDYYDVAWRYSAHSMYLATLGRLDEADALLRRGEKLIVQNDRGQPDAPIIVNMAQAEIAMQKGDLARAESLIRRSIAGQRKLYGRSLVLADYLSRYGQLLTIMNRSDEALQALNEAAQIAVTFDSSNSRLYSKIDTAKIEALARLRRLGEAERLLAKASANLSDVPGRRLNEGLLLRARAVFHIAQGKLGEATKDLDAAGLVFKMVGAPRALSDVARIRAELNRLKVRAASSRVPVPSGGEQSARSAP